MKFRKITFNDNPILGSVSFDFTDATGKTIDTIILAGENGCGKSYLLSFLNTYNPGMMAKTLGYTMQVEVELSNVEVQALMANKDFANALGQRYTGNIVTFVHDTKFTDDNPRAEFVNKSGNKDSEYAFQFGRVPSIYKTVFSDVEINFSPKNISNTSSCVLDVDNASSERSSHNLATEIKQLLIDIDELDNGELAKWVDGHKGQVPIEDVIHKRIRRFTNAFDKIFPHKRFVGIANQNNQKQVYFEEFGSKWRLAN